MSEVRGALRRHVPSLPGAWWADVAHDCYAGPDQPGRLVAYDRAEDSVGDLHYLACRDCCVGLLEHVQVDPAWRRGGVGTQLVLAAWATLSLWHARWSTTPLDNTIEAHGFASTITTTYRTAPWGTPRPCGHMGAEPPGS